jgi:Uma2 family endonuclease
MIGNFAMKSLAKWSVADYHRMVEAGILNGRSVELLAGEIVEMSPETPLHYTIAKRGARYLETLLMGQAEVRFNGPITLADSEPEPDIAIVRPPDSAYLDCHPTPEDIFWIVEVAKSSLKSDLELKSTIYAAADIQEYWVLDLTAQQLVVFQSPQASQYTKQRIVTEGNIFPLAFPNILVSVQQLFT